MSWDGGDYNFIGSTEFVEKNVDDLRDNAYAYINLDKAVIGNEFHAGGSPMLLKSLMQAMNRIADPKLNGTLKELWYDRGAELEGLAAHSDYVAFQNIAGTSCLDLEFRGDPYPAQSSYDNFDLVEQVIDPEFVYHGLMAQLMGLLVLDLADKAILPIDVTAYGPALEARVSDLEKWAGGRVDKDVNLSFKELKEAVKNVKEATEEFAKWEQIWDHAIMQNAGWETNDIGSQRFKYNDAVGNFDAALLDLEMGGGIPERTQFKHVVYGPDAWSSSKVSYFPAIRDLIEAKNWKEAKRFISKTSAILNKAASTLNFDDNNESGDDKGKKQR
jgi:N-acetylated-alpha-linked acidic dipeptidase